jgi:CDP-diacylglycerol--serine O-phosphatidyltransferase
MRTAGYQRALRLAAPQGLTATRLALGTAALIAAVDGRLRDAATLISLGAVTDGLDGLVARRLDAASPFGALFDYFADYICYVVAPWAAARELLGVERSALQEIALALPLITAAVRYARNGPVVADPRTPANDLPGLGTLYFGFLVVVAVFLEVRTTVDLSLFAMLWPLVIVVFAALMVLPVRCPKLAEFRGLSPVVLTLTAIMPFVATQLLAAAMLVIGLAYPVVASLALDRPARHAHTR